MSAPLSIESLAVAVDLGLVLRDLYTREEHALGTLTARISQFDPELLPEHLLARYQPVQKAERAAFVFRGLPPGNYEAIITSNRDTRDRLPPYYHPVTVPFSVLNLTPAQFAEELEDPAFRDGLQIRRDLLPTVHYPFPPGASLVRGRVIGADGLPAAGVIVSGESTDPDSRDPATNLPVLEQVSYEATGPDGEFVLPFQIVSARAAGQDVIVRTDHPSHPGPEQVNLRRGRTATLNFQP